jgi:FkbH-like protein
MFEAEVNQLQEPISQLPEDVVRFFESSASSILMRTLLPWGEHCTECVWPTCYTTCDLYEARPDGKCRRFVNGMVRLDCPGSINGYVLKIGFKHWAKLWSEGNIHLYEREEAARMEKRDFRIGTTLQTLVMPTSARTFLSTKRYSIKRRTAQNAKPTNQVPTAFLVECYNPMNQPIALSLTMRSNDASVKVPFQELLVVEPGPNRLRVPFDSINAVVPLDYSFSVELIPNDVTQGTVLYFGLMDFVKDVQSKFDRRQKALTETPKIKCVVWDLDNTLWEGVLVEDGKERLRLREGLREVLEELDRRGILLSIASKNHHEEAMEVLRTLGISDLFLCPQISWNPKSDSISAIVKNLNIGIDTLLFVDDSIFEREQVCAAHPGIRAIDAVEYKTLLHRAELNVPVTDESRTRRQMYQVENQRQVLAEGFGQDYFAFLKNCALRVTLRRMNADNIDRVHELTQRTNQMNFSGNRYDRSRLEEILKSSYLDTFVIKCDDKFGSYGVVGFAIVDNREPRLTDLMFSCRIQSKRVEHAFLSHIVRTYTSKLRPLFHANYKKTSRNAPSGKVFADMGFVETSIEDGVSRLQVSFDRVAPDDNVIAIEDQIIQAIKDGSS